MAGPDHSSGRGGIDLRWRWIAIFLLAPSIAWADAKSTMDICRTAAIRAADDAGIPREVLLAITLVETGTNRGGVSGPWPWTLNVAGKGVWFNSRAAALVHAQHTLANGQTSFDVGCFQLNYRWHGSAFASIDQMFEPGPSGAYAAKFLKSLHTETGDWIKAAGFYHSRTSKHAKRYRNLVAQAVKRMGGAPIPDPPRVASSGTGKETTLGARPTKLAAQGLLRRGGGALVTRRAAGATSPTSSGGVALLMLRPAAQGLLGRSKPGKGG